MDITNISDLLKKTHLINNQIKIGGFVLQGKKYEGKSFEYLDSEFQLLGRSHTYIFPVQNKDLILSIQLYKNSAGYYRVFGNTKIGGNIGMAFSLNLTTEKDEKGAIFLNQKIKFGEKIEGNSKIGEEHRRTKQKIFLGFLKKLGFIVTENNDLILGIYDTTNNQFLNTSSEKFIEDFVVISLLKGHFMGNKGYQLEILPSYDFYQDIEYSDIDENLLSEKIKENKSSRIIPLGLRFKVLERDSGKCKLCGISAKDGAKLHIDHIIPYSLGGLTILGNLQTLCLECNIGKSNKSTRRF